ncbi:ComEC/Rec2 family competence protein [bacterium]|nr:ComEC/Rec2 family competence protein [bacterium]
MPYLVIWVSVLIGTLLGGYSLYALIFLILVQFFSSGVVKPWLRLACIFLCITFIFNLKMGLSVLTVGENCQIIVLKEYDRAVMGKIWKCRGKSSSEGYLYVPCSGYRCPSLYSTQEVVIKNLEKFGRFIGKGELVPIKSNQEIPPFYYRILREGNRAKVSFYGWLSSDIPDDQAALVASMLFGEVGLTPSLKQVMKEVGALHIIAISGVNIIYLQSLLSSITRNFQRKLRVLMDFLALLLLYVVVGETVSIMRAILMVILAFVTSLVGAKKTHWYFFLGLSFLLLIDSSYFADAGYWLVSGACFGVYILWPLVQRKVKANALFAELIKGVLIWICVSPIQWFIFGEVQPLGILVGLVLGPLIEVVTIFGYVATIVRFLPILDKVIVILLGVFSSAILLVIGVFHDNT